MIVPITLLVVCK